MRWPRCSAGALAALCVAGVVIALVWINRVSADVMAGGGSCASGGPYVSVRPCPETTWMMPAGIFGGLALAAAYSAVSVPGGPKWALLAWPALFVSLGVQFARFADDVQTVPYIICAAVFLAMGAGPVVLALVTARPAVWELLVGDPAEHGRSTDLGAGAASVPDRLAGAIGQARARVSGDAERMLASRRHTTAAERIGPDAASAPAEVVAALNRVVKLHRQGALTVDEFEAAKRAILRMDEGQS